MLESGFDAVLCVFGCTNLAARTHGLFTAPCMAHFHAREPQYAFERQLRRYVQAASAGAITLRNYGLFHLSGVCRQSAGRQKALTAPHLVVEGQFPRQVVLDVIYGRRLCAGDCLR
jgi:hypothetical protein